MEKWARSHRPGWRRWLARGIGAVALLLAIVAFLPAWQTDLWFIRLLDYPRMQLGFAGLFVAIVYAVLVPGTWRPRPLLVLSLLLCATAWQFLHAARFLFVYPDEVESVANCPAEKRLSMLGANVLIENRDYGKLLALAERADADIILLTESDRAWQEAMRPLHADYPHRVAVPLENSYGMHLYSRLPMTGKVRYRVKDDIPSIDAQVTLRDGSEIILYAIHPEPPLPGDDTDERDAELVLVGREARQEGGASIVLGDLNDVAWSDTTQLFVEVSGTKDPRVGRRLMPTFNANWPMMRWPLDHMFVTPHWGLVAMERLEHVGSDHFPVLFTACLTHDADERLVSRQADDGTEAEASEQVREGREEEANEVGGAER